VVPVVPVGVPEGRWQGLIVTMVPAAAGPVLVVAVTLAQVLPVVVAAAVVLVLVLMTVLPVVLVRVPPVTLQPKTVPLPVLRALPLAEVVSPSPWPPT
jgi:hypothetical protein